MKKVQWGSYADVCAGWSHEDKAQRFTCPHCLDCAPPKRRKNPWPLIVLAAALLATTLYALSPNEECQQVCEMPL